MDKGRPNGSLTKEIPQKVFDALELYIWVTKEDGKNISLADLGQSFLWIFVLTSIFA